MGFEKRNTVVWVKETSMRRDNPLLHANYAAKMLVLFSAGADFAGLSDFSLSQSKCLNLTAWLHAH